jgi:hypothetical protein
MGFTRWQWYYNTTQHAKIHMTKAKHYPRNRPWKRIDEMLKIAHCLDNRLTDGGNVVSPMHRPRYTPQKQNFLLLVLISIKGLVNRRA